MPRPLPINRKPLLADDPSGKSKRRLHLDQTLIYVGGIFLAVFLAGSVLLMTRLSPNTTPLQHTVTPYLSPAPNIHGSIVNQDTQNPLGGASLEFYRTGSYSDTVVYRWITNEYGQFEGRLNSDTRLFNRVEISASGCETQTLTRYEFYGQPQIGLSCPDRQ